ncbi:MAG: TraM recognition domain-containing protein [Nitrososphaerales archaeon]|nr:TraM recognition domain-containing protein [Nitrososphaerales archaeon]
MARILDSNDMLFHMLIVGGTGSGKTNSILYMFDLLFNKKVEGTVPPSLFLFDPAGDASIDLFRAIPESELGRVVVLDPQYVTFGFNLLSLPEGLEPDEKVEVLQIQVEEFSVLLSDVFNTEAANAPRLMWIFKGALYYLYTFTNDPTFWELYNIMLLFTKKSAREIEDLLKRRGVESEIIRETMEAISKLNADAYMPVINRISNFVLPPSSITFRTFCSRKSTFDLEKLMEPDKLTMFRMPSSLPAEFRKLFASAVVMKLYFASLKRAKRLERSGLPPAARTPVVLAADEFRDITQLRILRTVLSQSRKFGLYLWMAVQTLSEVPEELMGSIQANVGSILAFRGSPDDARKLSKLLHPQKTEAVEKLIPGLEDYAAIVRKRPVGGLPVEPPFRVVFPKLRDPVRGYREALDYMKVEMEKRYGGAVGDRELIYVKDAEEAKKERGECYLGGPLSWVPLAYLHHIGTDISFSHMSRLFEDSCRWTAQVLQIGLSGLADSGRVEERVGAGQLYVGVDPQTKQAMWKEPETDDERLRAREAFYKITPAAEKEFFEFGGKTWAKSGRVGGPLHVRVMKALLEKYWEKGYWCAFDRGDRLGEFPDILVTKPLKMYPKGKEGRPSAYTSTDDWDESSRMPVEVEITPSKNPEQVRKNYEKNVKKYEKVRFVVASRAQVTDIYTILQDKDQKAFEVVYEPVGLPESEVEKLIVQEKALEPGPNGVPSSAGPVAEQQRTENEKAKTRTEQTPALQKNEFWILAKICESGWGGRTALASSLGVTGRQVTRYLDSLEEKGLVQKKGKGYRATEAGRNLVAQAGWTSANLQARLDDTKVDMSGS